MVTYSTSPSKNPACPAARAQKLNLDFESSISCQPIGTRRFRV